MSYWDTSALPKLYLVEPDSAKFDGLAQRQVPSESHRWFAMKLG
jgi:hypothetical protein